ncbi:MAG: membrane protein insertase YidC [Opitutaceae bacterium]|nr:membrane protein insertase YidC [Opitutaceae bacterium]
MDKKNTTIGVLLLIAAFASLYFGSRLSPPPTQPAPEVVQPAGPLPLTPNRAAQPVPAPTSPADATFAAVTKEGADAQITTLANDFIEVHLTDFGGAIREVALKKYDAEKSKHGVSYVINQLHADPALALVDFPGLDRGTRYQLVSATPTEVVYRAVFEQRIEVTRRYTLAPIGAKGRDPYQLGLEATFRNLTDQTAPLPRVAISLGTAAPVNADDLGEYLSTGHNGNGTISFTQRSDLQGGGLLSFVGIGSRAPIPNIETPGPLLWASVSNQFFTSILTPEKPAGGLTTRRVELPPFAGTMVPAVGITGAARFDLPPLTPHGEARLALQFYTGPKEYHRLANSDVFKADQDKVMQFGFFKYFSQILLALMTWMHSWTANWGAAIILTTLLLKIIFLPLTLAASKSAKRMQKIQPEMQALREKFKDNPQKLQAETMAIFKKHRVNPVGGCLPILITIPFFMGFFTMLQSTAELRFAEFLWAHDLSTSDTVARIFGLPLNIMPVLMGATMIFQMRLVPQPTVDNAQAKMFKFMPYVFTLFCYNFSCALSLYSTVNGLFTIGQQLIINRLKDDPEPAQAPASGGKPMKNVTPPKKK